MKQRTNTNLLSFITLSLGIAAAAGCAAEPKATGDGGGGAGGGSAVAGVVLVPDETGWIDGMATGNTVGVQGAWYPYGDAYGEAKCLIAHTAAECSVIMTPDPVATGFPNQGGMMCTSGSVAQVLGTPPDYANMWGAGIGLDLNATGGANSVKEPWNADMYGVKGISFVLDKVPVPGLRVEFPIPSTEGGTAGSNYWGATGSYPNSNVKAGVNVIRWDAVKAPVGAMGTEAPNHQQMLLAIQFHVPSTPAARGMYDFCVSELKFLTE